MRKNIKYAMILLTICAVSAFALALTNSITSPVIAQMDADNRVKALEAVSAGYDIGEQKEVTGHAYVTYVIDLQKDAEVTGYILGAENRWIWR